MFKHLLILFVALPFYSCGQPEACDETIFYHHLGDDSVAVSITDFGGDQQRVYINLHDDESTSLAATIPLLKERGGLLIRILNNGNRLVRFNIDGKEYAFDPNRMFSRNGIVHTLIRTKRISNKAIEEISAFAAVFLQQIPANRQMVIALHNNTPGRLSVDSYFDAGDNVTDAREATRNSSHDPDDFILTTDSTIYERLKKKFNIVWQDNLKARQDGSLSVYFGERGVSYINCETEHGHVQEFRKMIRAIHEN